VTDRGYAIAFAAVGMFALLAIPIVPVRGEHADASHTG
jgi:hypothetical protein